MPTRKPVALVIDADPALATLLEEWLGEQGIEVAQGITGDRACAERYDFAIIDVPYPRQGGATRIANIANAHPGMPIIAVSAAFFPCVAHQGAVARELGVANVLPKPLSRSALLDIVDRLVSPPR